MTLQRISQKEHPEPALSVGNNDGPTSSLLALGPQHIVVTQQGALFGAFYEVSM